MWPRARLRRVGEGQCGGVDDAVVPHQRDGDLDGLPHPAPALAEGRDVGHHAQHALCTPEVGRGVGGEGGGIRGGDMI